MGHYLFSFHGRANRAKMWLFILVVIVFEIAAVCALLASLGFGNISQAAQNHTLPALIMSSAAFKPVFALVCLLFLALVVAGFAVATRRLHDRNKSAWWLLIFYALPFALNAPRQIWLWQSLHGHALADAVAHGTPMPAESPVAILLSGAATIISLWAFVELYCLRGTVGDNRYGPDPLAR